MDPEACVGTFTQRRLTTDSQRNVLNASGDFSQRRGSAESGFRPRKTRVFRALGLRVTGARVAHR